MFVHWDGASWTVHTNAYLYDGVIRDLSGTSPDDAWALETTGASKSVLIEWDGQQWLRAGHPRQPTANQLSACVGTRMSALSRADLLIVGEGGCSARYQNGAWSHVSPSPAHAAAGLWAGGSSEAWTTGHDASGAPVVAHWDGSAWTAVPTGLSSALHDIWSAGGSSTDVWAVGGAGTIVRFRR
jgi:hypothetical protein